MKLNAAQLRKVEERFGIEPIPEEHSIQPSLKDTFGDHTFFLDAGGLNIVEPDSSPGSSDAKVVKLASWSTEEKNELVAHRPEVLPTTVDLGPDEPDTAS
jgi:hypothetical protein